jgi:4-methyl-5(b-hydroxyethyl)-thiazole monophosphate biosynthesis
MKKVLLLLCEGVEVLEAATFYDVLGWSGASGLDPVKVITAGLHTEVNCSFGLKIIPDALLQEIDVTQFDALQFLVALKHLAFIKMHIQNKL